MTRLELSMLTRRPVLVAGVGIIAAGLLGLALATGAHRAQAADRTLMAKIKAAFPNTKVGSIKCGVAPGLCEVTAGKNVFYVSPNGRYALVGSVLDLKDRVDLTDRRLKELAVLETATSAIDGPSSSSMEAGPDNPGRDGALKATAAAGPVPALGRIKLDLPLDNAIVHHPGAPLKVSVISDLNCGYCKMLFEALKAAPDIEVTEYPIQLLRPDSLDKAKLALCAHDREATSDALYFGGEVKAPGDCTTAIAAVQANTAFARAHGIVGTPTIIRADGEAKPGYLPLDQLRAWLKEAKA